MIQKVSSTLVTASVLFACAGSKPESKVATAVAPTPPSTAQHAPAREGNPRDDLIPRSVLFGNPERLNVQISPDGAYLSWLAPSDGVLNVWVAQADDLASARPVTADKQRPVRAYHWTYDRKHLVYLQDTAGDENFHLFRVTVATGEVMDLTPIAGAKAEVVRLSERRPDQLLAIINDRDPTAFDLYRIDIASGKRTLLVKNEQALIGYNVDNDLNVRFIERLEPDGTRMLDAWDEKAKRGQPYERFAFEDSMTSYVLGFDKRNAGYYLLDSRERHTGALYKVDAKTKQKTLVYQDDRSDLDHNVITHPTEHTVRAVQVNYDKPRWVALDRDVERDLAGLRKLGDGALSVVSQTLDDKLWIVQLRSDHASPKYYRWDRAKQQGTFLFSVRPALDGQPLVPMHPVTIEARDGLTLVSYLSLPKSADDDADGKPERAVPMVLLVHGGPWARDEWGYSGVHQLLANRGYAVLSVNYRGSTGFGKRFGNAGNKQWGKKMHEDLLDGVAWAVASGVTRRDQVCIMGGSYGGYATLAGLTLTPETFACGVDLVGISNLVTFIENIPPYWKPMMAEIRERVGDASTEEGKRALLAVSPVTHAASIRRPLLIAQGLNDPRVKKSESDQIVEAMKAKQLPVSYVVFPDEGHGFARPENNIAFTALSEAFLSVHLGGVYQPIRPEELAASSVSIEYGRASLPGLPSERAAATGGAGE